MDGGLPKIAKLNGHERRAMGDPIYILGSDDMDLDHVIA